MQQEVLAVRLALGDFTARVTGEVCFLLTNPYHGGLRPWGFARRQALVTAAIARVDFSRTPRHYRRASCRISQTSARRERWRQFNCPSSFGISQVSTSFRSSKYFDGTGVS